MRKLLIVLMIIAMTVFAANNAIIDASKVTGYKIQADTDSYLDINFNIKDINISETNTEKGVFSSVSIDNGYLSMEPGSPALPAMHEIIAMPYGATPEVEVISYDSKIYKLSELGIDHPIIPAQPSYSKSSKPEDRVFAYNESAYSASKFNGNAIAVVSKSGTMRGVGVGVLKVYPFKYNPSEGTLEVYNNLKVRVNYVNADPRAEEIKSESYSPYFESAYEQLINYKPSTAKSDLMSWPVTYLIVAGQALNGNADLQRLIDWKTEKGFNVVVNYVATSASINTNDTWVEQQWTNLTPKPSFVLIVGDADGTYAVQAELDPPLGSTGNVCGSDLIYGVIGSTGSSNRIPSMYVGRMTVRTASDLTAQVDKTIWYEKEQFDPTENPSQDFTYLTAPMGTAGYDTGFGTSHGNPQIQYGWTYYFTAANGMPNATTHYYPDSGSTTDEAEIVASISNGVNFYNYTAHGCNTGFQDPELYGANTIGKTNDVAAFGNVGEYPLIVGNCCLTNSFTNNSDTAPSYGGSDYCFGENLLKEANGGAIGYIGASMSTYWDEDLAMGVGVAAISQFPPPLDTSNPGMYDGVMALGYSSQAATKHVGLMAVEQLNTGYTDDYWSSYHLMGDPSLMVYFGIPTDITASYDGVIAPGVTSFSVNTDPYAYVSITRDSLGTTVLHGAARADASGVANVSIRPFTVGNTVDIVITNQFKKPYFSSILCTGDTGGTYSQSTTGLNYGNVYYGSSSTQQFTITNDHSSEYILGDITTIVGYTVNVATKGDVKGIKNVLSYSVAPNSSKTFDLVFEPTSGGNFNGNITITSSDTNHSTEYIAVTGTGIVPDINLNPASLSATAAPGATDVKTFDVENTDLGQLDYSMSVNYTSGKEIKASGGPDTYGYKWKDSDEADGPVYNWVDITGSGTSISLADDGVQTVSMGQTINFYGTDYTSIMIGANGGLSFTGTSLSYTNATIPTATAPNALICPFWDDLNPSTGGSIYYYNDTANSRFIVSYEGVVNYGTSDGNTFQVILYPSGKIIFQYGTMNGELISSTVGIESGDGTDGSLVIYNATYLHNDMAIQFQATPEWLSLDSTNGTIVGIGSDTITATCNATDLEEGVYTADIYVASSDPDESTLILPVTFTVTSTPVPPSAPTLASPANAGTTEDTTPAFDWNDASGATTYTILVDNNSNFASPEIDQTVAASTYTPGTALAYDTYYWKVLATNGEGSSAYSDTWTIVIEAPLTPPNITLSAATINTTAEPDAVDADSFDIGNTGEEDLTYDITYDYVVAKADVTVESNDFESGLVYTNSGAVNWVTAAEMTGNCAKATGTSNGLSTAIITSAAFDGTQCTSLTLTFDQIISVNSSRGPSFIVEYFNGTVWVEIYNETVSTTASQSIPLPVLAANMQLRFTGNISAKNGVDTWNIDNVNVYGPESGPSYTWLTIDSAVNGTVVPSGSNTINLTCDAAGLTDGTYNADITVTTNDPDEPTKVLPVEFVVANSTVIPAVPANVVTSISGTDLVIDWDVSADATGYDVYSSDDPYGTFTFEANVGTNQYTVAADQAKLFYYIVAKN